METGLAERARMIFSENLNLKLLSFAFALVLYSLVHGSQDAQRSMAVDIFVLLPPESANRVLVSQIPPRARITVRGSRTQLDELRGDDVGAIQLDLHSGTEKRVTLEPRLVHVPPGVKVEQIDPPAIDLAWEDEVVRDVPIQVSVVGTPASGFVVKGVPLAEPKTVRVHGPRSEVVVLQHARADAFDVTGLSDGTYSRSLAIDRPTGRILYAASSVLVTAQVTREIVERPFTKLAVAVVGPTKAKTQPAEVDVRLTCPPEVLRGLRPEQVVPKVEVTSKDPTGSVSLPVDVAVGKCEALVTPANVIVRW